MDSRLRGNDKIVGLPRFARSSIDAVIPANAGIHPMLPIQYWMFADAMSNAFEFFSRGAAQYSQPSMKRSGMLGQHLDRMFKPRKATSVFQRVTDTRCSINNTFVSKDLVERGLILHRLHNLFE